MLLITENTVEKVSYVEEAISNGEKQHYLQGVFLQAELQNKNGRIYPMRVMENAVKKYIESHVKENRAYGELGHPDKPTINLDRVCHIITELKREGNNYIGKAKITETPMGNIVKGLLKSGANLGVSSRGLGTLTPRKDGIMEVQDDYIISAGADVVSDPSAPAAYVKGILEGFEWIYDDRLGQWTQQIIEDQNKFAKNNYKKIDEQLALKMFSKFIKSI